MYFKEEEFTRSDTARRNGIDNSPDESVRANLRRLIAALEEIREGFGSAIIVTSGYRCPQLNRMVGGSKTSAHMRGLAADLVCKDNRKLFEYIRDHADFDQLIDEKNCSWVHFGLSETKNRHQVLVR